MKLIFDTDGDTLVFQFRDSKMGKKAVTTRDLGNNMSAGFDARGDIVYVELVKASVQYPVLQTFIAQAEELLKVKDALGSLDRNQPPLRPQPKGPPAGSPPRAPGP